MLWDDGPLWKVGDIEKLLPEEEKSDDSFIARDIFNMYERMLPPWARRELMTTKTPPAGKRSEMIWKLEHALLEAGLSKEEAFVLIKSSAWNKFKGRTSEDAQLKRELDKVVGERIKTGDKNSGTQKGFTKAQLLLSSASFVDGYVPPAYLIEGILQRRYLYSLTGKTGSGKTAVLLRIAAHIALGLQIGGRDVEQGKVLYFAGENPDDVRSRWILLCEELNIDPASVPVYFMAGTPDIGDDEIRKRINAEADLHGPFSALMIDTSAAYFKGDEENSNTQAGNHARMLRTFVELDGGPTIIVACHPAKAASDDSLLPRGGGAFLAEVDGNLVARKQGDRIIEITTQGKFRGLEFPPFSFELVPGQSDKLIDTKGRHIWSVVAKPIGDEFDATRGAVRAEPGKVLSEMLRHPGASISELACYCEFINDGEPNRSKVQRILRGLTTRRLVAKHPKTGHYVLTAEGKDAAAAH
jgi:AAA domain